ncbi:hypothetical protein BGAL_0950g00010 [Botrytis galanthina]|uniref:AAA+ ATPase domain-containing protein n=1 Tax=Botrytis galanthina TaxID=278940 RepID=A0A4S8QH64_9HELO|nr:hypothetical protein BGAL_0950g00010 [Botrytis galanthina]
MELKQCHSFQTSETTRFHPLLSHISDESHEDSKGSSSQIKQQVDAFLSSPIFSAAAYDLVIRSVSASLTTIPDITPQYGLLGIEVGEEGCTVEAGPRLLLANLNMPWSAFICGSQGAGKSHTLSCLLESSLLKDNSAGELPSPLAGLVMHYDAFTSSNTSQLCEAVYLCSSGIPVTIMVSPSNIWSMKRLYGELSLHNNGGLPPRVVPLYLNEDQLDSSRILKLMAFDPNSDNVPLYMGAVMSIIREIAMSGVKFTYTLFRQRLADVRWTAGQKTPLNMRLQMLDTFLAPSTKTKIMKPAAAEENIWSFQPGSLTIIDLSDPFMSTGDACCLFSICLSIFLENRGECGQVVVLDEAHKFLLQSGDARILTNDLKSVIRQQRHTGTRVLIATQEPTLSPDLIDLANVTFVHRFQSPAWYSTLRKHLAGADSDDLFHEIVALRTGEAFLFCPTARIVVDGNITKCKQLDNLGGKRLRIRMRQRITADGGKSIMANDQKKIGSMIMETVRMHVVTGKSSHENLDKKMRSNIPNPSTESSSSKLITPSKISNVQKVATDTGQDKGKRATAAPATVTSSKNQVGKHDKIDPNTMVKSNASQSSMPPSGKKSNHELNSHELIQTKAQLDSSIEQHVSVAATDTRFLTTSEIPRTKKKKLFRIYRQTIRLSPEFISIAQMREIFFERFEAALVRKRAK